MFKDDLVEIKTRRNKSSQKLPIAAL